MRKGGNKNYGVPLVCRSLEPILKRYLLIIDSLNALVAYKDVEIR